MINIGRIKTVLVKRVTKQLVREHADEFSEDFGKNKGVVQKYTNLKSSKIRNVIAGYVSRLMRQAKEGRERRRTKPEDLSRFY